MAKFIRRALQEKLDQKQIELGEDQFKWTLVNMVPAVAKNAASELVWSMGSEQDLVHYIEDPVINECYFLVEGPAQEVNMKKIAEQIPVFDPELLFQKARLVSNSQQLILFVPKLAISAPPEKEQRYFDFFKAVLESANADLAYEALLGMSFVAWKDFEPLFEAQLDHKEKDLRELAAFLLKSLRSKVWK